MKIVGKIDTENAFFCTERELYYALQAILIRLEQKHGTLYEIINKEECI